jgi:DGQHR domain-containing protein
MAEPIILKDLSGYHDTRDLLVTRYHRGPGRSIFAIALPLHLIPSHLPKPDPDEPFEGNRRVDLLHARKFAKYWMERDDWACPPILLDTNATMKFDVKFEASGVQVGILSLPHNSAGTLDILDGQHRILGWYLALEDIGSDLKKARASVVQARRDEDIAAEQVWTDRVERLEFLEARLRNEYVTMELVGGVTLQEHKQAFADITNNARGITKSKTVEFDSVSIINRVTREICDSHEFLSGRVDFERDRATGKNDNFVSARNVSDIVRHVALGIRGRMNDRREAAFKDERLVSLSNRYFDVLAEAFPALQDLVDGDTTPETLRRTSLLASPTILRVLAGVFHNLAVELDDDIPKLREEGVTAAKEFFEKLAPHMDAPVLEGNPWMATGVFPEEGGMAPGSRSQELSGLTDTLTAWATGAEAMPF